MSESVAIIVFLTSFFDFALIRSTCVVGLDLHTAHFISFFVFLSLLFFISPELQWSIHRRSQDFQLGDQSFKNITQQQKPRFSTGGSKYKKYYPTEETDLENFGVGIKI